MPWFGGKIETAQSGTTDSLDAFSSEQSGDASAASTDSSSRRRTNGFLAIPLVIVAVAGVGGYFVQKWRPLPVEAAAASLTIESDPAGAEVVADGVRQGTTPLTLTVAPGDHVLEVVSAGRRKTLRARARAGAAVVHHVEFESPSPAPATPAVKPIARQPVAPVARAAQGPGWLTVKSPVPLDVLERNEVIGTSQSSRIMMPAGRHQLRFANKALGISVRRTVRLSSGKATSIAVDFPDAPLSINAVPWADVWVDGTRVGETPIGNRLVTVGTHEIVFRHPELGERRQTVTVSSKGPTRVSADMRKPQ